MEHECQFNNHQTCLYCGRPEQLTKKEWNEANKMAKETRRKMGVEEY